MPGGSVITVGISGKVIVDGSGSFGIRDTSSSSSGSSVGSTGALLRGGGAGGGAVGGATVVVVVGVVDGVVEVAVVVVEVAVVGGVVDVVVADVTDDVVEVVVAGALPPVESLNRPTTINATRMAASAAHAASNERLRYHGSGGTWGLIGPVDSSGSGIGWVSAWS
jgi:hypothetical protein